MKKNTWEKKKGGDPLTRRHEKAKAEKKTKLSYTKKRTVGGGVVRRGKRFRKL